MRENNNEAENSSKAPDSQKWWVQAKEDMDRHSTALHAMFTPVYPLNSIQELRRDLFYKMFVHRFGDEGYVDTTLKQVEQVLDFILNGLDKGDALTELDMNNTFVQFCQLVKNAETGEITTNEFEEAWELAKKLCLGDPNDLLWSKSSWPQTKEEVVSEGAGWIMRDVAEAWKEKWEDSIRVARERLAGDDPEKNKVFDSLIQSEMFVHGGTVKFVPNAKCDSDPSIQEKFNGKWNVQSPANSGAPTDPSQEEVHGGGDSPDTPMSLWEICEKIRGSRGMPFVQPGVILEKSRGDYVLTVFTPPSRYFGHMRTIISSDSVSPKENENMAREILMGFPPLKK